MKTLKRKIALALALCLIMSVYFCIPAYAEDTSGKTTLTATVPECTYTFSIPADTDIAYNETEVTIGTVSVSSVQHLGNRVICVDIFPDEYLVSTTSSADKISFGVYGTNEAVSGNGATETTNWDASDNSVREIVADNAHILRTITVKASISEDAWKNANPGTYEGTIEFVFSVCTE